MKFRQLFVKRDANMYEFETRNTAKFAQKLKARFELAKLLSNIVQTWSSQVNINFTVSLFRGTRLSQSISVLYQITKISIHHHQQPKNTIFHIISIFSMSFMFCILIASDMLILLFRQNPSSKACWQVRAEGAPVSPRPWPRPRPSSRTTTWRASRSRRAAGRPSAAAS